jgi:hypothetical protein
VVVLLHAPPYDAPYPLFEYADVVANGAANVETLRLRDAFLERDRLPGFAH